jgi:hypothetical protein
VLPVWGGSNFFCVGNKDVDNEPVAQQDWRNGVVKSCLRAVVRVVKRLSYGFYLLRS